MAGTPAHGEVGLEAVVGLAPRPHDRPEVAVHALLLSFGIIFVAELGDKSQLMALALAARYRPWPVLVGITVATAASTPSRWSPVG